MIIFTSIIKKNLLFLQVGYNTVYIINICLGKKRKLYLRSLFLLFYLTFNTELKIK